MSTDVGNATFLSFALAVIGGDRGMQETRL